ncbi:MAG TPA: hypothetical protein VGE09_06500 [Pseudoxanthomonas sp.]
MGTKQRNLTDQDVRDWMERHDLGSMGLTDARAAIEDAQAIHLLPPACTHEKSGSVHYGYVRCDDCGYVRTDSGWGCASNRWFEDLAAARFYKRHGRLPEVA